MSSRLEGKGQVILTIQRKKLVRKENKNKEE